MSPRLALPKRLNHRVQEALIRVYLRNIPEHSPAKAIKRLRILDNLLQLVSANIARVSTSLIARGANKHLRILILRRLARPLVPGVKVEVGLVFGGGLEGLQTAGVVVELDEDRVDGHRSVQDVFVCGVGIGALRGGCQIDPLGAVGVGELAQSACERRHVLRGGFEVEVEAVDRRVSEGSEDLAVGCAVVVGTG